MDAFFQRLDADRFAATELTRGPWDVGMQHAGPPAALLGWALESCGARDDAQVVRVTFEILRPVPIGELSVAAEIVRGGRNVELLTGELTAAGQTLLRARAWRIRTADIGVSAIPDASLPPAPDALAEAGPFPWTADVGYHTAIEWRFASGGFLDPGPAVVWLRMRHPLIAGEQPSPLTRVLIAADSGNGVSAVLDFTRYLFLNTDLTVALHRLPAGEWVCLDAATTIQPHGIGLAESRILDERGVLGGGIQSLFVAPRPDSRS